jgi:hypothetical protein
MTVSSRRIFDSLFLREERLRERPVNSTKWAQLTVLCGHTRGGGEAEILPNLRVLTGGARYGNPAVQRVIGVG